MSEWILRTKTIQTMTHVQPATWIAAVLGTGCQPVMPYSPSPFLSFYSNLSFCFSSTWTRTHLVVSCPINTILRELWEIMWGILFSEAEIFNIHPIIASPVGLIRLYPEFSARRFRFWKPASYMFVFIRIVRFRWRAYTLKLFFLLID